MLFLYAQNNLQIIIKRAQMIRIGQYSIETES